MNPAEIVLTIVLIAAAAAAVIAIIRRKKSGRSCSCGCENCPHQCQKNKLPPS